MESWRALIQNGRYDLQRGDIDAALRVSAEALLADPNAEDAVLFRADVLTAAGRIDERAELLGRACESPAACVGVLLRFADHCAEMNQLPDAAAWFEDAAEKDPASPRAWMGLAVVWCWMDDYDRSADAALRARELDPQSFDVLEALVTALRLAGRSDDVLRYEAEAGRFAGTPVHGRALGLFLFSLLYAGANEAAVFDGHRRFSDHVESQTPLAPWPFDNDAEPRRRLRIGYYSPEFNMKWMPRFILPWLSAHDPVNVETVAYLNTQDQGELELARGCPWRGGATCTECRAWTRAG